MSTSSTPDTSTMVTTTLTGIIPGTAELFIDQDAAPGTPEWFVSVAACNLRDAAALLHDCLQDAGRLPSAPTSRRAGLTENPDSVSTVDLRDTLRDRHSLSTESADQWVTSVIDQYNRAGGDVIDPDRITPAQSEFLLGSAANLMAESADRTEGQA